MQPCDAWLDRYAALVPCRFSANDARVFIELLSEDAPRLGEALVALADSGVDWCA